VCNARAADLLPGVDGRRFADQHTGGCERVIEASVPVRICDNGGWTDTWFGGPGRVLNIAVTPGVDVSIRAGPGPSPVVLDVEHFGDRYPIVPGAARVARHPLLEAAIDAFARNDLSVIVARVAAVGPNHYGMDLQLPENAFRFKRWIAARSSSRAHKATEARS